MQDEQLHPDFAAELDGLAPRFEALGLSDIAARLRALTAEPRSESPQAAPQLGRLLELQLLSILDETDQA